MASPIRQSISLSKEAAVALAAGKQTALMLSLTPRWSTCSSCLRRPWGPSLTMLAGMPRRSTAFVCQKSAPEQSPAFSSSVSWEMRDLISIKLSLLLLCEQVHRGQIPLFVYLRYVADQTLGIGCLRMENHLVRLA